MIANTMRSGNYFIENSRIFVTLSPIQKKVLLHYEHLIGLAPMGSPWYWTIIKSEVNGVFSVWVFPNLFRE